MQLEQHFADEMGQQLGPDFPTDIAVAVSGGGDSMVMLHLAAGWARRYGIRLWPVTVDHGLRAESAKEAALVADECAGLGLPHKTLTWAGWDGQGNLQAAARQARRDLIGGWLGDCRHVLMAHTQDDQAETVVMRLLRGSGVDGLAAISPSIRVTANGAEFRIIRPLLSVSRARLRHHAKTLRIPFVDDPSNDDPKFQRVRVRRLIEDEGWDIATLSQTARAMQRARIVLDDLAAERAHEIADASAPAFGYLAFDRDGLAASPEETRLRLLASALCRVSGNAYRPRLSALTDALDRALSGGRSTLHGALVFARGEQIAICREFNAVRGAQAEIGTIWDGRWQVLGPAKQGAVVRALGDDGLAARPDWRDLGVPREVLRVSPAVWADQALLAAPLLDADRAYTACNVAPAQLLADDH